MRSVAERVERPAPRGRDEIRTALAAAALELFAQRGPAGVTTREVARAASVNLGLLHRHVGSKDDLVRLTLERAARPVVDDLRRAGRPSAVADDGSGDPVGGSGVDVTDLITTLRRHRDYLRLVARIVLDEGDRAGELTGLPLASALGGAGVGLDGSMGAAAVWGVLLFEPYLSTLFEASAPGPATVDARLAELVAPLLRAEPAA